MKIKYNRFALVPHTCSNCGKSFWLEPYKHSSFDRFSPLGGFSIVTANICKECANELNKEQTDATN